MAKSQSKLKVFKQNHALMTKLGIHSYHLTEPTNDFFKSIGTYVFLIIIVVFYVIETAAYIILKTEDFRDAMDPCFVLIGGLQLGGMHVGFGLKMRKVKAVHLILQEIVDEASEGDEINNYWKCEKQSFTFMKRIGLFVPFNQAMQTIPLIYAIFTICIGTFDASTLPLNLKLAVPFDYETIWGWFVMWGMQFSMTLGYGLSLVSITSFFVGCCNYLSAIRDQFEFSILSTKIATETSQNETNPQNRKILEVKITEKLTESIKIHINLLDVFYKLADINSCVIFSLLPVNVVFLAMGLYNMEHVAFEVFSFFFHIVCILCSLIWPSCFCYFASVTTEKVSSVGDIAYCSNWYEYPIHLQKYVTLVIVRSQEPMYFTGFNLIRCTVETFGKLFKSSCSYYLILRSFTEI